MRKVNKQLPHIIMQQDENGADTECVLAYVHPASDKARALVMGGERSQWVWVRLINGDLILGVFPQADTYCAVEIDAAHPHKKGG